MWTSLILTLSTATLGADPAIGLLRDGLPNVLGLLREGKPVTIAYFGGSLMAGVGASQPKVTSFQGRIARWFSTEFPRSPITHQNAAIDGTGSRFGVFRVADDLLTVQPDLILIEFAADDAHTPDPWIDRSIEGIVRQLHRSNPRTEIVLIEAFTLEQVPEILANRVTHAVARQEKVAQHYGIPSVNLATSIVAKLRDGTISGSDYSRDGLHPTDLGHQLNADALINFLAFARDHPGDPGPHPLPDPLHSDHLENAQIIAPERFGPLADGWSLTSAQPLRRFRQVVTASRPGAELFVRFRGSTVGISLQVGPDTGTFESQIDGGRWIRTDPREEIAKPGLRARGIILETGLVNGNHDLRIRILAEGPGRVTRIGGLLVATDAKQE